MGLLAAAQGGDLPPLFKKHNAHNMPAPLLIAQACAVTLFSSVFLFMPTVSSAYWILTATLAQIYLLMYILLFTAAIRLRYKHPLTPRAYRIPGGNWGIWLVGGTGLLGTLATFFVGFFPPEQIAVGSPLYYIGFLVLSIVLVATAPSLILLWKKPYWQTTEKGPSP
jgi:amino acid transporter